MAKKVTRMKEALNVVASDIDGKLKAQIIDECYNRLKNQKKSTKEPKGRITALIAQETNIPENYVKSYLHEKSGKRKKTNEQILRSKALRDLRYLSNEIEELRGTEELDKHVVNQLKTLRDLLNEVIKEYEKQQR